MLTALARLTLIATLATPASAAAEGVGILLLAHGGAPEWNARVLDVARAVDHTQPTEVAFGMATRRTMQEAVDRLNARGVDRIVAVPLFVSSWSSVITSSEYLLGLRAEAPPDLAIFARMDHERPAGGDAAAHHEHTGTDGAMPVVSKVPIVTLTPALNAHRVVTEILTSRALALSRNPQEEAIVIIAHGPVTDAENRLWLADMQQVATGVSAAGRFHAVDYLTVKDDAPKPVRDAATAELRNLVSRRLGEGKRVLIVPLLLSFGGIEKGIATRLEGLPYTMADAALMPDARLEQWVLEMGAAAPR